MTWCLIGGAIGVAISSHSVVTIDPIDVAFDAISRTKSAYIG